MAFVTGVREDAQRRITETVRGAQRSMWVALAETDQRLAERLREIRASVEASTWDGESQQAFESRLDRELDAHRSEILSAVDRGVVAAAEAGEVTHAEGQRVLDAIRNPTAPRLGFVDVRALRPSATALRQRFATDVAVRLAARQTQSRTRLAAEMGRQLRMGLQQGQSVRAMTERLLSVQNPEVALPRYVTDLQAALRTGNHGAVRAAAQQALGAARGLTHRPPNELDLATQAMGQRVLRAVDRGRILDANRVADYWILDRARYDARRIARTEMTRAFQGAYRASVGESRMVKGYRWEISAAHPAVDICDVYAEADPDGLGEGIYHVDSTDVAPPVHPHCFCYFAAELYTPEEISRGAHEGERPPRTPDPDAFDRHLRSLPTAKREQILGKGRAQALMAAPPGSPAAQGIVNPTTGALAPLWQIRGLPPPARGPRRIVQARSVPSARYLPAQLARSRKTSYPEYQGGGTPPAAPPPPAAPAAPAAPPAPAAARAAPARAPGGPAMPAGMPPPRMAHGRGTQRNGLGHGMAQGGKSVDGLPLVPRTADGIRGWASRVLERGLEASSWKGEVAVRQGLRQLIQSFRPEVSSRDAANRFQRARDRIGWSARGMRNAAANHAAWDGQVRVSPRTTRDFRGAIQRLAGRSRAEPHPDHWAALKTLIHEEIHGMSGRVTMNQGYGIDDAGRGWLSGLEEAAVESFARVVLEDVAAAAGHTLPNRHVRTPAVSRNRSRGYGSYSGWVNQLWADVATVSGTDGAETRALMRDGLGRFFTHREPPGVSQRWDGVRELADSIAAAVPAERLSAGRTRAHIADELRRRFSRADSGFRGAPRWESEVVAEPFRGE